MATQIASTTFCLDTNDPDGELLKQSPPPEIVQTGLLKNSPMARIWLNYYLNMTSGNSTFMQDELLGVGTVLSYISGSEPNFASDFIGTWVNIGTQSIGGRTVAYFERTA